MRASLVPENPAVREDLLQKAGIDQWYEKAGYPRERDEYSIDQRSFGGQRVLSLDQLFEDHTPEWVEGILTPLIDSEGVTVDPDEFLEEITLTAGLTPGEADAVAWIAEGNPTNGSWAVLLGQSLGVDRDAARKAWSRAKRKLRGEWTREPVQAVREPIRGQREGAGVYPWEAYAVWWDYHRPRFDTTPSWV